MTFDQSLAYKNGNWAPLSEISWSVTDLGTTHGAMLVERLRTIGGRLHDVAEHLTRLADGAEQLGISWPPNGESLSQLCDELVDRNQALLEQESDLGIVLLLSPGDPGVDRALTSTSTLMGHVVPLPFVQLAHWYEHGANLHFASTRNVPAECWSPSIKTRSRLQYFLADRNLGRNGSTIAGQAASQGTQGNRLPGSIAVLLSTRNFVTETSISNLLLIDKNRVMRSPPLEDILHGVSLKTVCEIASSMNLPVEFSDIQPDDFYTASEVLMTGTTGCLWSAVTIEGHPIGNGQPGPICTQLQEAWQKRVGFDFTVQAFQRFT